MKRRVKVVFSGVPYYKYKRLARRYRSINRKYKESLGPHETIMGDDREQVHASSATLSAIDRLLHTEYDQQGRKRVRADPFIGPIDEL